MDISAADGVQVSVDGQRFDIENFFYLKEKGFRKDKVDFNKGWLGISMENAEEKGILVKEITKGSPADEAGLKVGDIITKLNNETTIDKEGLNLIKFK
ncbi:MAG: PDZ domain-containing protein, partial [Candidatus Brocadiaceae bacterium]|nr:PDZ domain-containing protein [Candidatus Brocadiaceae bacterium]